MYYFQLRNPSIQIHKKITYLGNNKHTHTLYIHIYIHIDNICIYVGFLIFHAV